MVPLIVKHARSQGPEPLSALTAFAAWVEDRLETPCLRNIDSFSQRLLRGESTSLTGQNTSVQNTKIALKVKVKCH